MVDIIFDEDEVKMLIEMTDVDFDEVDEIGALGYIGGYLKGKLKSAKDV